MFLAPRHSHGQAQPHRSSPTFEEDSYLVQGWKVEDAERLEKIDIPGHESVVEIPRRMVQFSLELKQDAKDSDPEVKKNDADPDV
ncbi:hypothetical protein [Streptomyces fulvorobeus]|uniref:hypothetical protein n=1 Tax=Streptomyces fulvorobeus TaxID=284028 RepID=UPI003530C18D